MTADPASGPVALSKTPAPEPQITKPPNPRRQIIDGIRNNSTVEMSSALQLDRSLLNVALFHAVYKGSAPLTTYLLTIERADVHRWLIRM